MQYTVIMTISTHDNIKAAVTESASLIVETIPRVTQLLRAELLQAGPEGLGLSMPHFRALIFLERTPGASVGAVAEYLGLSVSNVSKLLYALAERGFVAHTASREDRRRVILLLTEQGAAMVLAARRLAVERLVAQMEERAVSAEELADIAAAMRCLQRILPTAVTSTATP